MTATFRGVLDHVIGAEGVLSIRFASGEVRLRAVDGTAVRVRDRSDHDIAAMFEIDRAEGSLSLHLEQGRGWFTAKGHTPELDVEVPRRAAIVIESASGDIAGEGLAGDQRYRTTSGDVRAPPLRRADRGRGRLRRHRCRGRRRDRPLGPDGFRRRRGPCRDAPRTPGVHDERRPQDRRTVLVRWRVRGRDRQWRRARRPGRRRHRSR